MNEHDALNGMGDVDFWEWADEHIVSNMGVVGVIFHPVQDRWCVKIVPCLGDEQISYGYLRQEALRSAVSKFNENIEKWNVRHGGTND